MGTTRLTHNSSTHNTTTILKTIHIYFKPRFFIPENEDELSGYDWKLGDVMYFMIVLNSHLVLSVMVIQRERSELEQIFYEDTA